MATVFVHVLPSSPQLRSDPPVVLCEVDADVCSATVGEIPVGGGGANNLAGNDLDKITHQTLLLPGVN